MTQSQVSKLTPREVRALRTHGRIVLPLDVRTPDARQARPHEIPGARWLPLPDVVQRAAELPRDATIVAYCT